MDKEVKQFSDLIFVGQGPNLKGDAGKRIGGLLGMDVSAFAHTFKRTNLNRRFVGKNGKGDEFDFYEGRLAVEKLLNDISLRRFVLFGDLVQRTFQFRDRFGRKVPLSPLEIHKVSGKSFFALPGDVNFFWNSTENKTKAARLLREFVFGNLAGSRGGNKI